ncbi:Flp family type IVb pilin [Variovorax ginsengisoli]|uniref:Pilus assembly protein Flp/PilA n=1 Tax=Variovorax ginsengisoli TaxID=363844 RepID=A0ABT9SFZ5_9BURK|nr:Flp family type IVb pilin [Variovorax ginsengisoli]MDP9902716.1 pilus assembly protein Flp/PilA [Variovorax ginsengisoli]
MKNAIVNFLRDEEGATAIEYGLIAGLISIAIAVVVGTIGTNLNDLFTTISEKLVAPT